MTTETLPIFWFDAHTEKKKRLEAEIASTASALDTAPSQLKAGYRYMHNVYNLKALRGYKEAMRIKDMPYSFTKYLRKKSHELQFAFFRDRNNVRNYLHTLTNAPSKLARLNYELDDLLETPPPPQRAVDITGLEAFLYDGCIQIKRPATVAKLSEFIPCSVDVTFEAEPCIQIPPYVIRLNPSASAPVINIYCDPDYIGSAFTTTFNRHAPNPHCLGSGTPCFGDFIAPVQDALEAQDLHLLVEIVDAFMRQINVRDSAGGQWHTILQHPSGSPILRLDSRFIISPEGVVRCIRREDTE